jgi:hypothetical protein
LPIYVIAGTRDPVSANNKGPEQLLYFPSLSRRLLFSQLFPTAVETGPILVAVTGNAAIAVTDIALNYFDCQAVN